MENGKSVLSDTAILIVCSVFGVNEDWLRDGSGPMFLPEKNTEIVGKGLIGARRRDVRKERGLSQAEFGEWIGFHKSRVYNVENGKSIPSDDFYQHLAGNSMSAICGSGQEKQMKDLLSMTD